MFYTFLRTHERGKHANQSCGAKETTSGRFALYGKKENYRLLILTRQNSVNIINHVSHIIL
jgi:diaminopimelate epimerase